MKPIIFVFSIIGIIWAIPAQAAWQYTKWGMTATQVTKASRNTTFVGPNSQGNSALQASYSSGKFKFTAEFSFEGGGLSEVSLLLLAGNPNELIGSLRSKYGEPENETPGFIHAWRWRTKSDTVSVMMTNEKTMVFYTPAVGLNEKGL